MPNGHELPTKIGCSAPDSWINTQQWTTCGAARSQQTVISGTTPRGRHQGRQLKTSVQQLEAPGFDLFDENEAQVRSTFQPTTTNNMAQFHESLRQKLSSPGAYTNHYLLQLTAWTLHKNIEIHDIFDTHVMTLSGEPPWLPSDSSFALSPLSTIRIAYRQNQKYWSYDQTFGPINRHDGHYWAIIPCGNQPDREETAARVSMVKEP